MARRLRRCGATVTVEHAATASTAGAGPWDAVLIDRALDGDATASAARTLRDATKRLIVLLTPAERPHLPALSDLGFGGYLVKPVRGASLAARLASNETPEAPAADPERSADTAPVRRRLSILVAEDNEINALLARALLVKLGHDPVVAA